MTRLLVTDSNGEALEWHPYDDLDDAKADHPGEGFFYRSMEERPLVIPDAEHLHELVAEWIFDNSSLNEEGYEVASAAARHADAAIGALAAALIDHNETAWYPVGPVVAVEAQL